MGSLVERSFIDFISLNVFNLSISGLAKADLSKSTASLYVCLSHSRALIKVKALPFNCCFNNRYLSKSGKLNLEIVASNEKINLVQFSPSLPSNDGKGAIGVFKMLLGAD